MKLKEKYYLIVKIIIVCYKVVSIMQCSIHLFLPVKNYR